MASENMFMIGFLLHLLQPGCRTGPGEEGDQVAPSPRQVLSFVSSSERKTVVVLSTSVVHN